MTTDYLYVMSFRTLLTLTILRHLKDLSIRCLFRTNLVLLDSRRIVLPLLAVKPVLRLLHASHSGITKTTVLAKALYFWPGMSNDIKQLISSCVQCAKVLPSQPSNPMVTPSPSTHFGFPMQHVGLDLFSFGTKTYLICVDHWSGYPFYSSLRSLSTSTVISTLSTWFNLFGWPMSIRSDGGPQFRGDFSRFCEKNDIRHELSAPYNPCLLYTSPSPRD